MSEIYKYLKKDNSKVKVESANRDGNGERIDTRYAKQDGDYSEVGLVSALATNFKTNRGQTSTYPITFAPSGIVGGSQYADLMTGVQKLVALRGNSVAWNQLVPNGNFEIASGWGINGGTRNISNNKATITPTSANSSIYHSISDLPTGHTYLFKATITMSASDSVQVRFGWHAGTQYVQDLSTTQRTDVSLITTITTTGNTYAYIYINGNTNLNSYTIENFQIFDLTMLEQNGVSISTVAEFNNLFPLPYYEYNAGELLSCQSNKLVSVWYNAYDNENPNDYIRVVAGETYTLEGTYTSVELYDGEKNALTDTFTSGSALPNNCHYLVISGGSTDTCLHLTHSGSKTGFEPYEKHEYNLPNVELRSAGSVYDELTPDGKLTRRIGVVDLGTLNWSYNSQYNDHCYIAYLESAFNSENVVANLLCSKYQTIKNSNQLTATSGISNLQKYIRISDSNFVNDLTAFKSAMSGVYLFYELATETEETTATFEEYFYADDYGTLEFESEQTLQVPQGYEILYPLAMNDFLGRLMQRDDISSSPNNLVSQSQLANYLKTLSGYDASKTQSIKNVNGTLQWVDD